MRVLIAVTMLAVVGCGGAEESAETFGGADFVAMTQGCEWSLAAEMGEPVAGYDHMTYCGHGIFCPDACPEICNEDEPCAGGDECVMEMLPNGSGLCR